jgi:hypothetical protein
MTFWDWALCRCQARPNLLNQGQSLIDTQLIDAQLLKCRSHANLGYEFAGAIRIDVILP